MTNRQWLLDLFNKKKVSKLENEIDHQYKLLEAKNVTINKLESEVASRRLENEKLVNWIMNILQQFGTTDARGMQHVRIPVNKNFEPVYSVREGMRTVEEIHIPSITVAKVRCHIDDK